MPELVNFAVPALGVLPLPSVEFPRARDVQVTFMSIPAASIGGSGAIEAAFSELANELARSEGVTTGPTILVEDPMSTSLRWASDHLSEVVRFGLPRIPRLRKEASDTEPGTDAFMARASREMPTETLTQWVPYGLAAEWRVALKAQPARPLARQWPEQREARIAQFELPRLQQAATADRAVDDPLLSDVLFSLEQAQVWAVRNSPIGFKSAVELASATTPGGVFLAADGFGVGSVCVTAAGIFVVYIVIPTLRGVGLGLEQVMKNLTLRLDPGPAEDRSTATGRVIAAAPDGAAEDAKASKKPGKGGKSGKDAKASKKPSKGGKSGKDAKASKKPSKGSKSGKANKGGKRGKSGGHGTGNVGHGSDT